MCLSLSVHASKSHATCFSKSCQELVCLRVVLEKGLSYYRDVHGGKSTAPETLTLRKLIEHC